MPKNCGSILQVEDSRTPATDRLLQQLRLDSTQREAPRVSGRRRGMSILILVVSALKAGTGVFFLLAAEPVEAETAVAMLPSLQAAPSPVLQATGYVTARMRATVSSQIPGSLTQVLIEEGEHVETGQVLARLDTQRKRPPCHKQKRNLRPHVHSSPRTTLNLRRHAEILNALRSWCPVV